jgi:hypothetical protein
MHLSRLWSILPDLLLIASVAFRIFINFICFLGVFLIVYVILSTHYHSSWMLLDDIAPFVSALFTLVGTALTAVSVYFYRRGMSPPEKLSVFVFAPVVVISCGIAAYFLFQYHQLPQNVVNGFALLAIGGALNRLHRNPGGNRRIYWDRAAQDGTAGD